MFVAFNSKKYIRRKHSDTSASQLPTQPSAFDRLNGYTVSALHLPAGTSRPSRPSEVTKNALTPTVSIRNGFPSGFDLATVEISDKPYSRQNNHRLDHSHRVMDGWMLRGWMWEWRM